MGKRTGKIPSKYNKGWYVSDAGAPTSDTLFIKLKSLEDRLPSTVEEAKQLKTTNFFQAKPFTTEDEGVTSFFRTGLLGSETINFIFASAYTHVTEEQRELARSVSGLEGGELYKHIGLFQKHAPLDIRNEVEQQGAINYIKAHKKEFARWLYEEKGISGSDLDLPDTLEKARSAGDTIAKVAAMGEAFRGDIDVGKAINEGKFKMDFSSDMHKHFDENGGEFLLTWKDFKTLVKTQFIEKHNEGKRNEALVDAVRTSVFDALTTKTLLKLGSEAHVEDSQIPPGAMRKAEEIIRKYDSLQDTIMKSPAPKAFVTWRGNGNHGGEIAARGIGGVVEQDRTVISTSPIKEKSPTYFSDDGWIQKIYVPKGFPALSLQTTMYGRLGGDGGEAEVLLPKGTQFVVTKINENKKIVETVPLLPGTLKATDPSKSVASAVAERNRLINAANLWRKDTSVTKEVTAKKVFDIWEGKKSSVYAMDWDGKVFHYGEKGVTHIPSWDVPSHRKANLYKIKEKLENRRIAHREKARRQIDLGMAKKWGKKFGVPIRDENVAQVYRTGNSGRDINIQFKDGVRLNLTPTGVKKWKTREATKREKEEMIRKTRRMLQGRLPTSSTISLLKSLERGGKRKKSRSAKVMAPSISKGRGRKPQGKIPKGFQKLKDKLARGEKLTAHQRKQYEKWKKKYRG